MMFLVRLIAVNCGNLIMLGNKSVFDKMRLEEFGPTPCYEFKWEYLKLSSCIMCVFISLVCFCLQRNSFFL